MPRLSHRESAHEQVVAPARRGRRDLATGQRPREDLLDLQGLVGNAAVARLLAHNREAAASSPGPAGLVQRSPGFGLGTSSATAAFAETAVRWRRKYPRTTLENFTVIMVEEASDRLEKIGVPAVELDDGATTSVAVFHSSTWTISVNVENGTGRPPSTKIGDLKPEELADFTDTFFHEARHAEQRFLMARLAVSKSKDAKAIAAELLIPESVAVAAVKAGGKLPRAEQAKAEQLFEFFDKHLGYKMWNNGLHKSASDLRTSLPRPSPEGVDSITAAWNALAPKVEEWRKEVPWADREIESLAKLKKRDAVDEQVLRDVRKTRKALQVAFDTAKVLGNVVAEWPKMKARQTITVDDAQHVREVFSQKWREFGAAVYGVDAAAEDAYERYPEEADSRAIGRAVAAAIRRKAKTAAKPAKTGAH
jgi:hypothetical protein